MKIQFFFKIEYFSGFDYLFKINQVIFLNKNREVSIGTSYEKDCLKLDLFLRFRYATSLSYGYFQKFEL